MCIRNAVHLRTIITEARGALRAGRSNVATVKKEAQNLKEEILKFNRGERLYAPTDADGYEISYVKMPSRLKTFIEGAKKFLKEQRLARQEAKQAAKSSAKTSKTTSTVTAQAEEYKPQFQEEISKPAKPTVKYERKSYIDNKTGLKIEEKPYGDSAMVKQAYDSKNRCVNETWFEDGHVVGTIDKMFNPDGSKKFEKYVKGGVTQYEHTYDTKGRLIKWYELDIEGNKRTTTFEYDSTGKIIGKRMETVGDEYTNINEYKLGSDGKVKGYTTLLDSKTKEEIPGMRMDTSGGSTIDPAPRYY